MIEPRSFGNGRGRRQIFRDASGGGVVGSGVKAFGTLCRFAPAGQRYGKFLSLEIRELEGSDLDVFEVDFGGGAAVDL